MAEVSLKKTAAGAAPTGDVNVTDRCARLLGQLCVANSPIDPRAIRALNFLTDSVDVSGSNVNTTIVGIPNVDVTDRCARLLGTLCFGGIPIDPRIIRFLTFATDSIDITGSAVDVTDRCTRQLGTLCSGGVAIDPRDRNWDLDFASDQVDVSGSNVNATVVGTPNVNVTDREEREVGLVTMKDAFMELRLMAGALKDLPLALDPNTSRVRVVIESFPATVTEITNLSNIAGRNAIVFQDDIMYKTFLEAIREQII